MDMDYNKKIKEEQDKFSENPRESIKNLIKGLKEFVEGLYLLGLTQNRPQMSVLFNDFTKEYYSIINELYKLKIIFPVDLKDDEETIKIIMRIREIGEGVKDYQQKTKPIDVLALTLSRFYATSLEMVWNRLRKLIFLAGLNKKNEYLSLNKISDKIKGLEKNYNLKLIKIKSYLDSELRNSVDHENTKFEFPNTIIFLERNGKEIQRMNTEEICERLIEFLVINTAIEHVNQTLIISSLEPLLKLTDEQLKEYCKTGILTEEMKKQIKTTS